MQWTVSSIRQRTTSDRMPVSLPITLQHLHQSLWKGKWTLKRIINATAAGQVPNSNAFTISYTTYDEVQKIILNLRNDCSSGHNNILVKFLKPVVDQITSPIVHINTSINKKIFPVSWKVARVFPIPKIGKPATVKDFRPISVLSVLSMIYEKLILSQLLNYIEKSAAYNSTQSVFVRVIRQQPFYLNSEILFEKPWIWMREQYQYSWTIPMHLTLSVTKPLWKSSFHWTIAIER